MTSHVSARRFSLVLVVVALLAGAGMLVGRAVVGSDPRMPGTSAIQALRAPSKDDRLAEALAVLRRWDALRATAYAAGDPRRLRQLYVPGSSAAAADVEILRSYAARGLVVDGMRTQLLAVEPVELREEQLTLRVRDRLVRAEVVDEEGRRLLLPRDGPTTRVVTLVQTDEAWRVSTVRQE